METAYGEAERPLVENGWSEDGPEEAVEIERDKDGFLVVSSESIPTVLTDEVVDRWTADLFHGIRTKELVGIRFNVAIGELFPADYDASPWLFRLAILRDDISYLVSELGLPDEPSAEDLWRSMRAIRGLSIAIKEVLNIFRNEASAFLKNGALGRDGRPLGTPKAHALLNELRSELESTWELLAPVRHSLGGHARPGSSDVAKTEFEGTDKIEIASLREYSNVRVEVRVDLATGRRTSFRQLTCLAVPMVLGMKEVETFAAWNKSLQLASRCGKIMQFIDVLIFVVWSGLNLERRRPSSGLTP